jgi:hypothetical protein
MGKLTGAYADWCEAVHRGLCHGHTGLFLLCVHGGMCGYRMVKTVEVQVPERRVEG